MVDEALTARTRSVPALLGAAVVALQLPWPLLSGGVRDAVTVAVVTLFAAACLAHAALTRGPAAAAALLVVTAVPGFAVEVLGVHAGVPFGRYDYSGTLGPELFGVPPVIGLAWTMLAWPAALAARRLVRGRGARVLVGAWALAGADLFLDPQLVGAGAWRWHEVGSHLPGVPSVPLSNLAGWLVVAVLMSPAVQAIAGAGESGERDDTVPVLLYLWLYVGWIVALAAFLDLRAAAAWGALGMGVVAVPLARRVLS